MLGSFGPCCGDQLGLPDALSILLAGGPPPASAGGGRSDVRQHVQGRVGAISDLRGIQL